MTNSTDVQSKTGGYQWVGDTAVYKNRNNQNVNYQGIRKADCIKETKKVRKVKHLFLVIF